MSRAPETDPASLDPLSRVLATVCLVLGVVLQLAFLDWTPIQRGNEAMYAFTPIQMLESGDLLVTRYQGENFLDKPSLPLWIVAASYRLFGVSVFAARLPTALAGLAAAAVLGLWIRRRSGAAAGWIAALALLFSFQLVFSGIVYAADTFLMLATLLAALALERAAVREEGSDAAAGGLAGAALALAFYCKGLVGIVLPVGAVAAALLLDRRRPVRPMARGAWAAGVFLALVAPWHAAMSARLGGEFWRVFYWENQFLRGATHLYMTGSRGPFYYVLVLAWAIFPWSYLLPLALRRRRPSSLPLGAFLVGLVFFSALVMKREIYLLPVLPAAAALVAEGSADEGRRRLEWRRVAWILAALMVVGLLAVWVRSFGELRAIAGLAETIGAGAALLALLGACAGAAAAPRRPAALLAVALGCGLLCVAIRFLDARVERFDPLPAWGERVRRDCAGGCDGFLYGQRSTSIDFYSRLDWEWLGVPAGEVPAKMRHAKAYLVIWTDQEEYLRGLPLPWRVLDRRAAIPSFDAALIGHGWEAARSMSLVVIEKPR